MFTALSEGINGCLRKAALEQLRAEAVYHALCTSVSYDHAAAESREKIASYLRLR